MYSRETNWTTNRTEMGKNLSRERNIASEDLPISILLLTKSMVEADDNGNRAPRSVSFKPNSNT